jgi:hypothetical protein
MRTLLLFLIITVSLFSVELEFNKTYVGPIKLTASSLGANMGVPAHWKAIAKKGEGLLLFQETSQDTITLRSKQFTANDALRYLNTTHYLKDNLKIFPQERIVKLNSHIFSRVYTSQGGITRAAHLIYIIVGTQSRAVVINISYDKKNENAIKAISMNIAQALSFTTTRQLKSLEHNLASRLKGLHIAYIKRDGAYDEKRELWLCSNQRYLIQENRTVAGGMSRVTEQKLGNWVFKNKQLILKGDDGLDRLITVELKDNALLFDGIRGYELNNRKCQ